MKWSIVFLTICLVFTFAEAGSDTQCWDMDTDHYWDVGTKYRRIGRCLTITCDEAGENEIQKDVGCGTFEPDDGCYLSGYDLTKPMPDCCPRQICDEKK